MHPVEGDGAMSAQIRFRMLEGVDIGALRGHHEILRTAHAPRAFWIILRTRRGRRERPRRDAPRLVSRVSPAPSPDDRVALPTNLAPEPARFSGRLDAPRSTF